MPPSKPTISYSPQSHSLRSRRSMNDLPLSESPSGRRDSTEQLLSKEEEEESEGVTRVNIPQHNSNWYPDEDFELDDENYASIARPPPQRASELLYAFRFVFVFAGVGFGFLILKLVLMKFGHNHGGHHQVAERHYYNGSEWFAPTVIMISLDGFRDDYLDRGVTPNLQQFASEGVSAEYMNPSFPSITFPNHWTLATGLYPESHGIVGNEFYDPELQEMFVHKKPSISTQPKWWKGEPIWATCKNQGRKSAVIMWPGSATPTTVANYLVDYDSTMTAQQKMDIALQWLDMPLEQRPQFIAIYIQQVDQKGHGGGPEGGQLNGVLTAMDDAVGKLLEGLKARNLDNQVNVVIVSDHGMAQTHRSRLIYYEDILSKESLSYLREREAWPLLSLRPKDDAPPHAVDQIYNELLNYTQSVDEPHFQVYLRQDIPERYNYRATDRIAPIVAIPDVGYSIVSHKDYDMNSKKPYHPMGIHGYDNLAPEMRAIFMARGPRVEKRYPRGSVVAPFFNVEVYAFVASLLNLDPAPNNGTLNGHFMVQ